MGAGANVNAKDHNQMTILMNCAFNFSEDTAESVKALIEKGAELNATDCNHRTALMLAASLGNVKVVKIIELLLEHNADVNLRCMSKWQMTPLHSAYGRFEVVKLFLEAGANVNAKDHNQMTILMNCAFNFSDD